MGIKGLTHLIGDHCQSTGAIKEDQLKNFFDRKIAVDARNGCSMCLYQFLIAMRGGSDFLTDANGDTTAHLVGLLFRTVRMVEHHIKPVYVFDGKAPDLKSGELDKRRARAEEARVELAKAEEEGNEEMMSKFSKRTVRATRQQSEEAKKLLKLMGIPIIEAPSEAEAQCAEMAKGGVVYGVASEDMDTLTFGAPKLLRHLFHSGKDIPVMEFSLAETLEGLELTMDQFVDVCILSGCDYCDSIRGIGPKKALALIKKHNTIENVLEHLDTKKYPVPPDPWPYKAARDFFKKPVCIPASEINLKWKDPDEEGLVEFLVGEKNFNVDRIRNACAKLRKHRAHHQQGRLTSFFGPVTVKRKIQKTDPKKNKRRKREKKKK